jgi:outer membrane protein TolC
MPQIALTGSAGKVYDPSFSGQETSSVGVRATIPFYAGGSIMSRIRESRQVENQRWMETRSAERSVRESVIAAWEDLVAAEAESRALQAQVRAAGLALDGVRMETSYGTRTTLDLLDAEQEYMDARVAAVGAETDLVIASYALLEAIGGLTAKSLGLDIKAPILTKNFQKNNKTN